MVPRHEPKAARRARPAKERRGNEGLAVDGVALRLAAQLGDEGQRRAPDAVSSEALRTAAAAAAAAAPAPPIAPAATAREPSVIPAGSTSADVAEPAAPNASAAPASSAAGESRVKKKAPAPAKSERARPSVAPGLELSTQGP